MQKQKASILLETIETMFINAASYQYFPSAIDWKTKSLMDSVRPRHVQKLNLQFWSRIMA